MKEESHEGRLAGRTAAGRELTVKRISLFGHVAVFIGVAFLTGLVIATLQAATGDFSGGESSMAWGLTGFFAVLTAVAVVPGIRVLGRADLRSAGLRDLAWLLAGSALVIVAVSLAIT